MGKPHGTSGEVYVVEISDDPQRFAPGARLLRADGSSLEVESARRHRNRFLVKFSGIETRAEAEELRGPLFVPSSARRALDEDEFWIGDVVGSTVVLPDGTEVGRVTAVVPAPAQDLLTVETAGGPRFVPVVKEIVRKLDPVARRIEVDPPEGLFD